MRVYLALTSEILRSGGVSGNRAAADKRIRVKKESHLVNFASFISLFVFCKTGLLISPIIFRFHFS